MPAETRVCGSWHPRGQCPSRDAVAMNCAATGRGTRLRGCPAEVSAQADTVSCSRRIYSDGEPAAILVLLGVTGQAAPLVSASAPRREVRAGGHVDCLRRSTRITYNLRGLSKVLKAGRASCRNLGPKRRQFRRNCSNYDGTVANFQVRRRYGAGFRQSGSTSRHPLSHVPSPYLPPVLQASMHVPVSPPLVSQV